MTAAGAASRSCRQRTVPSRCVVALRALGLGDFLTGIPAYRALARAFPDHHRSLIAPAPLASLLALVPALHALRIARGLDDAARAAADGSIEIAVNLHGRGPQSHRALLCGAPRALIAFAHASVPESRGGAHWRADEHEVARWSRMLRGAGIPCDPDALDLETPRGRSVVPSGCTLIHPGAASASRRWPVQRWASIAREELARGRPVYVTGSPGEAPLVRELAECSGLDPARCTRTALSLHALARAVRDSALVLCGDTGVGHLATALRRPSVLLFGPTSPARWGPPTGRRWHRVLWAGSEGDPHAEHPDPGLLQIHTCDVLREIEGLRAELEPELGTASDPLGVESRARTRAGCRP
jgi:ADP-heptose:LPS heptosyltransferase